MMPSMPVCEVCDVPASHYVGCWELCLCDTHYHDFCQGKSIKQMTEELEDER